MNGYKKLYDDVTVKKHIFRNFFTVGQRLINLYGIQFSANLCFYFKVMSTGVSLCSINLKHCICSLIRTSKFDFMCA